MRVLAVIPARYASTRLPGKPLAKIHGKPMIQWVYERTKLAQGLDSVIVATDDERVASAVRGFGGKVLLTATDLHSGTDRVAAVAEQIKADVYLNVQGDEPLIEPEVVEKAAELVTSGRFEMGTVMTPLTDGADLKSPSVVKVLADRNERAIYFSRLPIPYSSSQSISTESLDFNPCLCHFVCRRHLGIYAYSRQILFRLRSLPPSPIEKAEMLEQLRALEDGIAIGVAEVFSKSIGVDTPEDLERVKLILKGGE